jgi:hypothetical protein
MASASTVDASFSSSHLIELGAGFAFVGQQVHLEVSGEDFYIDLLFYRLKLRRYIVIDLLCGEPLNIHMAKKQQMRWSDEGAHTLALVRVADLNEELSAESFTRVTRFRPSVVEKSNEAFYVHAA